jgi:hypothetical protein
MLLLTSQCGMSNFYRLFRNSLRFSSFETTDQTIFCTSSPLFAALAATMGRHSGKSTGWLRIEQRRILAKTETDETGGKVDRRESGREEGENELMESQQLDMRLP